MMAENKEYKVYVRESDEVQVYSTETSWVDAQNAAEFLKKYEGKDAWAE